jgi:diguanylate cyclase (GGDEF)-like protein/PAS domain S-box-containing protein
VGGGVYGAEETGVAKVPIRVDDAPVLTTSRRPWLRVLIVGMVAVALCAVLPIDTAGLVVEIVGAYGIAALVRGAKRNGAPYLRPIKYIAAGGSAFLIGNIVRVVHGAITGVDAPFPSPGDALYYLGYCLLVVGIVMLVRRRSAQIEGDNLLDAGLIGTWLGVVALAFIVMPFLRSSTGGVGGQAMNVLYTVFDVVLLCTVIRLAVGSGRRVASYYFLLASMSAAALADIFITIAISTSGAASGAALGGMSQRIVMMTSPLAYIFAGAAGQHPSIAHLTDRPSLRDIHLSRARLTVLFLGVVGMLGLVPVAWAFGSPGQTAVAGAGAVAAILIVLARLALLVQANERKARREATLRDAAGELAQATSVSAMHTIGTSAFVRLLGSGSAWAIQDADGDGDVPADVMRRARVALLARTEGDAGVDLSEIERPKVVLAVPVLTRRCAPSVLVGATDVAVPRQLLHAMDTLATQLAGAVDGLLLAEEIYRQEQEQRFRALIEHSSDLLAVLDGDGLVMFASPASRALLGVPEGHLVGRHPFERVHPDDRFEAASLLDRAWAVPGVLEPLEARFRHETGDWRWFEVLVENLLDQPEVAAVIVHLRDVSDRRRAQERLAASEARFRSLVQHAADLIAIVDDDMLLTYVSPAARSMLGFEPDTLLGRPITDIIPAEQLFVDDGKLPALSEAHVRDASGQWRSAELTITDLRGDDAVGGIVINARDVSERKNLEDKLRHLAMHDPLTGLANRNLLHERLETALRDPSNAIAVLYLDIDDFKSLNDTLGHGYGDSALSEVARRLVANLRDADLAARLGGDEFAVLLEGAGAAAPMEVAERLLHALRAPIVLGHHRIQLTVSLGAAVREEGSTVVSLTRNADIAMYLAKTDGKDRRQLFEPEMLESFNTRIELKRDLQEVIDRGELRLVYQPVYELDSGRMVSVEALVRWDHPTRGLVPPLQFIPLAEESGAILQIGSWVLDRACAQLAAWRLAGGSPDLKVAVNLSVAQLEHQSLLAEVERTLARHGLEPSSLILEVTESVLAANIDLVQLQLSALSNLGVRLALDDFGTGYSSLGYLQHFQLDTLKIDKSFLGDTKDASQQEGLIRAIIEIARGRGMSTTAEGVEDETQLAMLARLGCTNVQGYLFAKPLPPDEVLHASDRAVEAVATVVLPIKAAGAH